jgi:hypothetical protein
MAQRTPYQDRIIRNYYQNLDTIAVQRLGELITDLYLAEGKSRTRLWQRAETLLGKLKIPAQRVQQIVKSDNPTLLANLVQELLGGASGPTSTPAPNPPVAAEKGRKRSPTK